MKHLAIWLTLCVLAGCLGSCASGDGESEATDGDTEIVDGDVSWPQPDGDEDGDGEASSEDGDTSENGEAEEEVGPDLALGDACTKAYECLSGYCVDGFCCDGACEGGCEACNLVGQEGSCSLREAGDDEECRLCWACDGQSADCAAQADADEGNKCESGCSKCKDGACVARNDKAECEACRTCEPGATGECSSQPNGPGGYLCETGCSKCEGGFCLARDDNEECADVCTECPVDSLDDCLTAGVEVTCDDLDDELCTYGLCDGLGSGEEHCVATPYSCNDPVVCALASCAGDGSCDYQAAEQDVFCDVDADPCMAELCDGEGHGAAHCLASLYDCGGKGSCNTADNYCLCDEQYAGNYCEACNAGYAGHPFCSAATCPDPVIIPDFAGYASFLDDTTGFSGSHNGSCGSDSHNAAEHVYSFTADADGIFCADTMESNFDTQLYVRSTCDSEGTEIACSDNRFGPLSSALFFEAEVGVPSYIFVDGYGSDEGEYRLALTEEEFCPATCGRPLSLDLDSTLTGSLGSWLDLHSGSCDASGAKPEAIWIYRAGIDGFVCLKRPVSDANDAVLYVRSDCDDGLSEVGCANAGGSAVAEQLQFEVQEGESYYIFLEQEADPSSFSLEFSTGECEE